MNRNYTIHTTKDGVNFINLTGETILSNTGKEFSSESFKLNVRRVKTYGKVPKEADLDKLPELKLNMVTIIPDMVDLEWVSKLPDSVLVATTPLHAHLFGFPTGYFTLLRDSEGKLQGYHDMTSFVWGMA
jgi:hypothetical protein